MTWRKVQCSIPLLVAGTATVYEVLDNGRLQSSRWLPVLVSLIVSIWIMYLGGIWVNRPVLRIFAAGASVVASAACLVGCLGLALVGVLLLFWEPLVGLVILCLGIGLILLMVYCIKSARLLVEWELGGGGLERQKRIDGRRAEEEADVLGNHPGWDQAKPK